MENTINGLVLQAASEGHSSVTDDLMPISDWMSEPGAAPSAGSKTRGGKHTMTVLVALSTSDELTPTRINALHRALRADSPDAPSTHAEAERLGRVWMEAEAKELRNHATNGSWTTVSRSEVPVSRRIHKLIWVYKLKRDGTAKARLCVQGNTLQSGIDYDQVFSAALRYSSARGLFAYTRRALVAECAASIWSPPTSKASSSTARWCTRGCRRATWNATRTGSLAWLESTSRSTASSKRDVGCSAYSSRGSASRASRLSTTPTRAFSLASTPTARS